MGKSKTLEFLKDYLIEEEVRNVLQKMRDYIIMNSRTLLLN